jgi:hypothetical protein
MSPFARVGAEGQVGEAEIRRAPGAQYLDSQTPSPAVASDAGVARPGTDQ